MFSKKHVTQIIEDIAMGKAIDLWKEVELMPFSEIELTQEQIDFFEEFGTIVDCEQGVFLVYESVKYEYIEITKQNSLEYSLQDKQNFCEIIRKKEAELNELYKKASELGIESNNK